MTADQFKSRTKKYGISIILSCETLAQGLAASIVIKQLLRSGTSVGANYRAACRARSNADFIGKMKIVEEECDESLYWMEILIEAGLASPDRLLPILREGSEILAMVVASTKTARHNR